MKTVLRAVVVVVVLASNVLAGASSAAAADPTPAPSVPVIGGDFQALSDRLILTSRSTFRVNVEVVAEGPYTLTPSAFQLDPGETIEVAVSGDPKGRVSAVMSSITSADGDASSVVLQVAFPKPLPPDFPWFVVVVVALVLGVALGGFYVVQRFRRTFVIVRKES